TEARGRVVVDRAGRGSARGHGSPATHRCAAFTDRCRARVGAGDGRVSAECLESGSRRRSEPMSRSVLMLMFVWCVVANACGGAGSAPTAEKTGEKPAGAKAPKDQIVLTAAEQATGKIETQRVETTDAPAPLRVSGDRK